MTVHELPTPRFQFRWKPIEHQSGANWMCFYELVIGFREYDIRRGTRNHRSMSLVLGRTRVTRTGPPMVCGRVDIPFRDGVHLKWDRAQLGPYPAFAIYGTIIMELTGNELIDTSLLAATPEAAQ